MRVHPPRCVLRLDTHRVSRNHKKQIQMKKLVSFILIPAVVAISALTAGPRPQSWQAQRNLSSVQDFQQLKPGDTVAQVCKMCDSVSMVKIESNEQAMVYCSEGAVISCPSCDSKAKVKLSGHRPKSPRTEVRYVDEQGDVCMFMAKMEQLGETHKSRNRGPKTPRRPL